mmetsp:Transcript_12977/g.37708  ORF Transcript_12977/g.37708 Transcript_12977/m.37708 type:complete len:230 (-) Transcript_12977:820-1509(-)
MFWSRSTCFLHALVMSVLSRLSVRQRTTRAWPCGTSLQNAEISHAHAFFIGYLKSMSSAMRTSWSKSAAVHDCDSVLRWSCRQRITRALPGLTSAQNSVRSSEHASYSTSSRRMSRAARCFRRCTSARHSVSLSSSSYCCRQLSTVLVSVPPALSSSSIDSSEWPHVASTSVSQASRSAVSRRKSATRLARIPSSSSLHCGLNLAWSMLSSRHSWTRMWPGGTLRQKRR